MVSDSTAIPMACRHCAKPIAPYDGHMMVMRYRVGDSGVDHFCSGACVRAYMAPEQGPGACRESPTDARVVELEARVRDLEQHATDMSGYAPIVPNEHAAQVGDPTVRHVVAWMRATYPQNQHAREWADEIAHVFLRQPRPKKERA